MDISMDSQVFLALALLLLEHKPKNVSVREYVNTLRSCTRSGKRPPDASPITEDGGGLRHVSGEDYWKQRFDEHEAKLMELQVQVRELDEEKRLLQLQRDAAVSEANTKNKKKHQKRLDPQVVIQDDECVKKWEACRAVYEPISPASSPLLGQLRILHLSDEHVAVAEAFGNACGTLLLAIEELCTNPHTPLLCPKPTTVITVSNKSESQNESICQAIDLVFRRLLASLTEFDSSTARAEHRTAVRSAFVGLLVGTVDAIHLNSKGLLTVSNGSTCASDDDIQDQLKKRDLRGGLTATLVSFISSLQYSSCLEREMLEAATYAVLEAAGRCLCQQAQQSGLSKQTEALSKPAALKATSTFVLDLLKCVLQKYKSHANNYGSALGQQALMRFHEAVMFGVFGGKHEVEVPSAVGDDDLNSPVTTTEKEDESNAILKAVVGKGKSWGGIETWDDFLLVDNSFADEVWKLVGLEVFMMTM